MMNLLPDQSPFRRDLTRILTPLLFFTAAAVILLTFRDYGITWDEEWHSTYGEYIIGWYTSLFDDKRALDYWTLKYYGGFFDIVANSIARFSPIGVFETRHLVNAAFGFLGVVYAYRIATYMQDRAAGLLAALFLLLTPAYYGHAFNNPKDIPFAALFTITLFYTIRLIKELPAPRWSLALKFAIAAGCTLGVRVGGVISIVLLVGSVLTWAAVRYFSGTLELDGWRGVRALITRLVVIVIVAYVVMLIAWPAAQVRPFAHPVRAYGVMSDYNWEYKVLFEGRRILATQLPWYYLPKWLLLALPEFFLAGLAAGIAYATIRLVRHARATLEHQRFVESVVLLAACLVPISFAVVTRATLYDGMRHFLFVVPTLAVLAALGWVNCLRAVRRWPRIALSVLLVVSLLWTLRDMVELHPNQYIYFNRAIGGGLNKAALSYETDYWGNTYREGVLWVAAHYRNDNRRIRVTSCSFPLSTRYYLPKRHFQYVRLNAGPADLFLATTRNDCHLRREGRVVHVVMRQGTPLLYIKELPGFDRTRGSSASGKESPASDI